MAALTAVETDARRMWSWIEELVWGCRGGLQFILGGKEEEDGTGPPQRELRRLCVLYEHLGTQGLWSEAAWVQILSLLLTSRRPWANH